MMLELFVCLIIMYNTVPCENILPNYQGTEYRPKAGQRKSQLVRTEDKKAVLSQGNRAIPQLLFLV